MGKFNVEDTNDTYALIIGNGSSNSNRSNLFAIGWDSKLYVNDSSGNFVGIDITQLSSSSEGSGSTVSWAGTTTSGEEIGKLTVDGTTYTLYSSTADEKVKNIPSTTTKAYLTGTSSTTQNTGYQYFDTNVYIGEESGSLYATTFYGALDGNASTSTTSTYATGVKVVETNPTSISYYYPYWGSETTTTGTSGATLRDNSGFKYATRTGTTKQNGLSQIIVGNSVKSGTAGNAEGAIAIYGSSSGYNSLSTNNSSTTNYNNYLPAESGTLALSTSTQVIELVSGKETLIANGPVVTVIFNNLYLSEYVAIGSEYLPITDVSFLLQTTNSDTGYYEIDDKSTTRGYVSLFEPAYGTITSSGLSDIIRIDQSVTAPLDSEIIWSAGGLTSTLLKSHFSENNKVRITGSVTYVRNYTT
jgi:hypothetical protein